MTTPTPRQLARRQATDEKIAAAVFALIRRDGLAGVTIEKVSKESGVATTTIYRRYDDRDELARAVVEQVPPPEFVPSPPTEEGLRQLLRQMVDFYQRRIGISMIGATLSLEGDQYSIWRERLVEPFIDQLREFFHTAQDAGAVSQDLDVELTIAMILGGTFVADVLCDACETSRVDDIVTKLWPVLQQPSATPSSGS